MRVRKPREETTTMEGGFYESVTLTDEQIETEAYKQYLGGGAEHWNRRGEFQLHFLQAMGLQRASKLLDVGCGPLRAGVHLIEFLDDRRYVGVDYNRDFVKAANRIVESSNLGLKHPTIELVNNFDFSRLDRSFDFALVFSVLNHCDEGQRAKFFAGISQPLKSGGRIYISHGKWLAMSYLSGSKLSLTNEFPQSSFDLRDYGWNDHEAEDVFPILELAI